MSISPTSWAYLFLQQAKEHAQSELISKIQVLAEVGMITNIVVKHRHSNGTLPDPRETNRQMSTTVTLEFETAEGVTSVEHLQFLNFCCYPSSTLVAKVNSTLETYISLAKTKYSTNV